MRKSTFWAAAGLSLLSLAGCVRREGRNSDCKWPGEPGASRLDPSRPSDARHLRADVEFAEELAIRYMDAHRDRERQAHRIACLGELFGEIGKSHQVPLGEVAAFQGRRNTVVDVALALPFFVLYGFVAGIAARWLLRRYPPGDGWGVTVLMVVLASLAFGLGGTMIGEQWSEIAENLRVWNGHLSYRVDLLPWARHEEAAFVVCLLVFWAAAIVRWSSSRHLG